MGRALELAVAERAEIVARVAELRGSLVAAVRAGDGIAETGHPTERLPGIASFVAPGLDGTAITIALDLAGLAASTGSACVSGSNELSHVLVAMGYGEEEARGALRFSLGRTTTATEIAEAAEMIVATLAHQREAAATLAAQRPVTLGVAAADHGAVAAGVAGAGAAAGVDVGAEAPAG
jgi:cysteine desulfurase